ncbi:selenide, water dikinase SelD [Desulfuromonas sp. KJ2020]|nr:selenide, water dikinase SelD [Desulfuromonas sp. KJ2020]
MGPETLAQVLCHLPTYNNDNLLSAAIPFADAGIYRLAEDMALVQSIDFFTPVVDDPFLYGQIAAANALSDIYTVGGRPLTALNLVGFPTCSLGTEMLTRILQGGADKVLEAGAVVVGGHSVQDDEPKFGLAVTGLVDPRRMVTTQGARAGDVLVLTKPLGTGLLTTAIKGEVLQEGDIPEALQGMSLLNRRASEIMMEVGISACTDVTGFGLLGHALEMAEASSVCLELEGAALPAYPRALEMADMGLVPEGSYANRAYYLPRVEQAAQASRAVLDLIADPQTSGGLLMAVPEARADSLCAKLREGGGQAFVIGRVLPAPAARLRLR